MAIKILGKLFAEVVPKTTPDGDGDCFIDGLDDGVWEIVVVAIVKIFESKFEEVGAEVLAGVGDFAGLGLFAGVGDLVGVGDFVGDGLRLGLGLGVGDGDGVGESVGPAKSISKTFEYPEYDVLFPLYRQAFILYLPGPA